MNKLLLAIFCVITMLFIIPFEGHAAKSDTYISAHYKAGYGHGYRHGGGHYGRYRHHYRGRHYRGHYYRGHHYGGSRYYFRGSFVFPWYPYGYHASPPVIIQQKPPVYVQPEQEKENYWYYCPDPQGYYPYIRDCASGWMKVVPDATPPDP
jgi:hypothetical protein